MSLEVLNRLHTQGVDQATLTSAKNYLSGQFPTRYETAGSLAALLDRLLPVLPPGMRDAGRLFFANSGSEAVSSVWSRSACPSSVAIRRSMDRRRSASVVSSPSIDVMMRTRSSSTCRPQTRNLRTSLTGIRLESNLARKPARTSSLAQLPQLAR